MKKRIRKTISVVLAAAVLCCFASVMSSAAIDGYVIKVDDARNVLRDAVGLADLSDEDKKIADMDFDSKISVADARALLRLAVQLDVIDGKTYENEYEMLSGGHFTADMVVCVPQDGSGTMEECPFKVAVTSYSSKMYVGSLMSMFEDEVGGDETMAKMFEMFKISAVLFTSGNISLLDDENMQSLTMSEKELGEDFSGMKEEIMNMVIPNLQSSLSDAASQKEEEYDGKKCIVYSFDYEEGGQKCTSKVYMDGKKLVKIDCVDEDGAVISSVRFDSLSRVVSVTDTDVSQYEDTAASVFASLFG